MQANGFSIPGPLCAGVVVVLSGLAGAARAGELAAPRATTPARACIPAEIGAVAEAGLDPRLMQVVGNHLFGLLPPEGQARVLAYDAAVKDFFGADAAAPSLLVARAVDADAVHASMLSEVRRRVLAGEPVPALCFAPGADDEFVGDVSTILGLAETNDRAQLGGRWSRTATNGSALSLGQPTVITYGFVPDGTYVPNRIGVTGYSNLQAFLNGIYGSPTGWQNAFAQVFSRWSALSGLDYVYEAADDGSSLNSAPGALGVRADVRIAGIALDGSYGVLAYNSFPNDGDMVIDSADAFFTSTAGNSLRLRNVVAHEHGHGIGLYHVCPIVETKLMEPYVTADFDGPQHDDIRGAHRLYGDAGEPDDTPAQATALGLLTTALPLVAGNTPAPAVANGSTLSIDADGEQDFFRFTIQSAVSLSATVAPIGLNYDDSPQACSGTGDCCSGNFTNSLAIANLNLEVRDRNGTTVLATAASAAAGASETITNLYLGTPGDYYVRVYEGNSPTEAQLYRLTLSAVAGASCSDGVQNQGETRIDCGGPCAACGCTTNAACNDGLYCDGIESCDAYGECQAGPPVCANQSCRESDDRCLAFGNGDYDVDGDVDMRDFAGIQACYGAEATGNCVRVNLAGDAEVDGADLGAFESRLTGP